MVSFKVREDITLNISEESQFCFEFFTFRSNEMVSELDYFIKYAKGKKCLLDIGAYHGIFSLVFSEINKESKSFAFEPYEIPFEFLSDNCNGNDNIVVLKLALSNETSNIPMFTYNEHLVGNKVSDAQTEMIVRSVIGDDFCTENEIIPDVLKIDCEGMELKVLQGLSKTIKQYHPTIFLELHCELLKDTNDIAEIINTVKLFGYHILDAQTGSEIFIGEILSIKEGELRLILL